MQQGINNAEKQGEKWAGKAQSTLDRGIADVKSLSDTDIKAVASDITSKVRDVSEDLFKDSVSFVKRYPVSSALGLAAAGFLAGVLVARSRD